jgi:putative heme-binding domain-containing protein
MRYFILTLGLVGCMAAQQDAKGPMPEQAKRGKQFFTNAPKGTSCGTCHRIEGTGTAVGPDLTRLGSLVSPKGLVMSINMTATAYLQTARIGRREFPAMVKSKEGDKMELWDLSGPQPNLMQVKTLDVESLKPGARWTHPPTAAAYSKEQLADIIGYLKWVSNGATAAIKPTDF